MTGSVLAKSFPAQYLLELRYQTLEEWLELVPCDQGRVFRVHSDLTLLHRLAEQQVLIITLDLLVDFFRVRWR